MVGASKSGVRSSKLCLTFLLPSILPLPLWHQSTLQVWHQSILCLCHISFTAIKLHVHFAGQCWEYRRTVFNGWLFYDAVTNAPNSTANVNGYSLPKGGRSAEESAMVCPLQLLMWSNAFSSAFKCTSAVVYLWMGCFIGALEEQGKCHDLPLCSSNVWMFECEWTVVMCQNPVKVLLLTREAAPILMWHAAR